MEEELKICTAAFFRSRGKDVITVMELVMTISLDLRWMDTATASRFVKLIISEGLVNATSDELLKISDDLIEMDVPIAYKPSKELLDQIKTSEPGKGIKKKMDSEKTEESVFSELMDIAKASGIPKGKFIAECNKIVKKLNVDTEVAALIILRDAGADMVPFYDRVYTSVSMK